MARPGELSPLSAGLPATFAPQAWVTGLQLTTDREL